MAAMGDVDGLARAAWGSARVCTARGDMDGAAVYADEAGRLAPACRDPILGAACFELAGDVAIRRGRIEDARRHLMSARALYRQHAEIVGEANVELSLAQLCERVGDSETGVVHLRAAAERYERAGRAKGQAQALTALAFAEAVRGHQELAEAHAEHAVRLVEHLDDPEAVANARLMRAQVRLSRDPSAARVELVEVLRAYEELSDHTGIANTQRWLMEAAASLPDITGTMIHFLAAIRAYLAIGSHYGAMLCWSFVADLLFRLDDVTSAEIAMGAGCASALDAGATAAAAKLCAGQARLVMSRGAIEDGLALLQRATELSAASNAAGVQVEIRPSLEETRGLLVACRSSNDSLSPNARLLLEILSLLEHPDLCDAAARTTFDCLWPVLGPAGQQPSFDDALVELRRARLVAAGATDVPIETPNLQLAPGLRAFTRALVDTEHAVQILDAIGSMWAAELLRDQQRPGRRTVRAGLGAAVYFKRLGRYLMAFKLLEATLQVARTTGESVHVVPHFYLVVIPSQDPQLMARLDALQAAGALADG